MLQFTGKLGQVHEIPVQRLMILHAFVVLAVGLILLNGLDEATVFVEHLLDVRRIGRLRLWWAGRVRRTILHLSVLLARRRNRRHMSRLIRLLRTGLLLSISDTHFDHAFTSLQWHSRSAAAQKSQVFPSTLHFSAANSGKKHSHKMTYAAHKANKM